MASVSSDYERFLKANFPDDYRKVTDPDVKDDVINAVLSRREGDYKIWCKVPEWIKAEYSDNLPDDVLNGNRTVRQFINDEINENKVEKKESEQLMNYGVSLLAAGYAAETVSQLVLNRELREDLLLMAAGGVLTAELKEKWRVTRENDRHLILKDWRENQVEKHFMHLVRELHRLEVKRAKEHTPAENAALEMKKAALERDFKEAAEKIKSEDTRVKLMEYMREGSQQNILSRLNGDLLARVTKALEGAGIKVEQVPTRAVARGVDRTSLAKDIREQIDQASVEERAKAKVAQYTKDSENIRTKKPKNKPEKTPEKTPEKLPFTFVRCSDSRQL